MIMDAHGCDADRAREVVILWLAAFNIDRKEIIREIPGHDKCELLREIRKKIARTNGIPFEPEECTHYGPCSGTCPVCDAEIRYPDRELSVKKEAGEEIHLEELRRRIWKKRSLRLRRNLGRVCLTQLTLWAS